MKYELPDIFLHFLNKDTQEIFEINDNENPNTLESLQLALNASILLCNEFCILPLGFYFESSNTKKMILNNIEYVRNGLLVFALREEEIQEYIDKKQEQLKGFMRDISYQRFFAEDEIASLSALKHGIIQRKTKIGQYCLLKWNESFSLFVEDYSGDLATIYRADQGINAINAIEIAKAIRDKTAQIENGVFIWKPIAAEYNKLSDRDIILERQTRRLFESYYYRAYLDEYHASILYDIFTFDRREDFLLKKEYVSASNYRWFVAFLKCLRLDLLLYSQPQQIVELKHLPEFVALRKIYLSICNEETFKHTTNSILNRVSEMCLTNSNNINDLVAAINSKLSFSESGKTIFLGGASMPSTDVKIGIITALPEEAAAVEVLLENTKPIRFDTGRDVAGNRYTLGSISLPDGNSHRIALCQLPEMGNNLASVVATKMQVFFPSIENIIICGIAGGVPCEVHLGDVVVSVDGVIQYDFGKDKVDDKGVAFFEEKETGTPCSLFLREAVMYLERQALINGHAWTNHIERVDKKTKADFSKPKWAEEQYYERDTAEEYILVKRPLAEEPSLHLGKIASGNVVKRNPQNRDALFEQHKISAIEMEAAGIKDGTRIEGNGYIAIRAICDYCDGTKGDDWHRYAAAVAAAYAYELIRSIPAYAKVTTNV